MSLLIKNCRVISPGVDLPEASLEIRGSTIHAIHEKGDSLPKTDQVTDGSGLIAVPGFIDIHTHGAGGGDACAASLSELRTMARAKLAEGVTTFLPTTLTLPQKDLVEIMRNIAAYQANQEFAEVPAVHIEGPFINPKCVGAQNPDFVRLPNIQEIEELNALAPVSVISMACEMEGGTEFIQQARALGFTISLAHTAATFAQFQAAKEAGLSHLTHFCNQMTPLHHREIGIVGAGLIDPDIRIELICDKLHLAPDMIRLVFATKPLRQLMLITDSIAASHLPDGKFAIGGLPVIVAKGAARLESGALAGSTLKFNDGLKNVYELTQLPLKDLIATTSLNQAQSLGWSNLGKLESGFRANITLLTPGFEVAKTFVNGQERQ